MVPDSNANLNAKLLTSISSLAFPDFKKYQVTRKMTDDGTIVSN